MPKISFIIYLSRDILDNISILWFNLSIQKNNIDKSIFYHGDKVFRIKLFFRGKIKPHNPQKRCLS
jgi:hypothetical protein